MEDERYDHVSDLGTLGRWKRKMAINSNDGRFGLDIWSSAESNEAPQTEFSNNLQELQHRAQTLLNGGRFRYLEIHQWVPREGWERIEIFDLDENASQDMSKAMPSEIANQIQESFLKQGLMSTIKASLAEVCYGQVSIVTKPTGATSQQHGYAHNGLISAIAETACGYAAQSMMGAQTEVTTAEYKVNFFAYVTADQIIARARVVRSGGGISVVQSDVYAEREGKEMLIAVMIATVSLHLRSKESLSFL